jgi:hypothetical protein
MLMASPIMAPTGVTSKSPELIPTRNSILRAGGSTPLQRAMSNCQATADFTAEPALLKSARIPSPTTWTIRPSICSTRSRTIFRQPLELTGCRAVVLLYQTGIAKHVSGQNRVHPAHVECAKLRGHFVAAVEELDAKRNPAATSIMSPLCRGRGSATGVPFTKVGFVGLRWVRIRVFVRQVSSKCSRDMAGWPI